jgi:hypothetical protein
MSDEETDDKKLRLELLSKLREEIHKRQLSNTENYDKAVLSLATAFLAASLTFLKDFVPFRDACWKALLPLSWALFGLAIVATIASFFTSQEELDAQLNRAEDYYLQEDESALERKSSFDKWTKALNLASAIAFILGIACTIVFISINLSEATMSNQGGGRNIQKGALTPSIQKAPGTGQMGNDGALVPSVQKVPTPPSGSKSGGQSGSSSGSSEKK